MKNVKRILLSAMIISMLIIPVKTFALDVATSYTVQTGDSLWIISTKLGVSIDYLKAVNNLSIDGLLQGQVLKLIPDSHIYVVKSGDSLWKIATANNVTVDYLKLLNNLNSDNLIVGQSINLLPTTITHTVQAGDTIYLLSKTFGSTVEDIKNINHLTLDSLTINQKILIPYKVQEIKDNNLVPVPAPIITPAPVVITGPQPVKDFPSITYIVQAGDSATSIAKKFSATASDIMKYNYMDVEDWFNEGQKIAINGYAPRDYAVTPGMDKAPTQYGNLVDWFRDGQYLLKRNEIFTVIDLSTRKQFTVKVLGGYKHCDIEPLTAADTEVMKSLFPVWNWTPRPVVVFKDGMNIAASLSGMPHSFDTIPTNGVEGHFDMYLKNSLPHEGSVSQTYVQQHYASILIAAGIK